MDGIGSRVSRTIQHRLGAAPGHSKLISVPAQQAKEKAFKTGYLEKVGFGVKTWKKRFFTYDGQLLLYFVSENSDKQKGEIVASEIFKVEKVEDAKKFCIAVHTEKRIYHLVGNTAQEVDEWKAILSGNIQETVTQVEKLNKSISTELLGTNDANLEKHVKNAQDILDQSADLLNSCAKGRQCVEAVRETMSKAMSSLQHRRRVTYASSLSDNSSYCTSTSTYGTSDFSSGVASGVAFSVDAPFSVPSTPSFH